MPGLLAGHLVDLVQGDAAVLLRHAARQELQRRTNSDKHSRQQAHTHMKNTYRTQGDTLLERAKLPGTPPPPPRLRVATHRAEL